MVGRNNLPRKLSLKSRLEIASLLRCGERFPTDYFTLIWKPAEQFRYGIFLSRKLGPAHRRNRLKRLHREALRLSRQCLEKPGLVALLPKKMNDEPKLDRLITDVSELFKRISN